MEEQVAREEQVAGELMKETASTHRSEFQMHTLHSTAPRRKLTTRYDSRGLVVDASSYGSSTTPVNSVGFIHNGWRQLTEKSQG